MPPRSNLAVRHDERPNRFDFTGRRLKLVPAPTPLELDTEASPMLEAIRRYLDALP